MDLKSMHFDKDAPRIVKSVDEWAEAPYIVIYFPRTRRAYKYAFADQYQKNQLMRYRRNVGRLVLMLRRAGIDGVPV